MAYRVEVELDIIARARRIKPVAYLNLTLMLALSVRYINELAARDAATFASELGPHGRNRAATLAVLDEAEASFKAWLAVASPGSFERTFWDEYQRGRAAWIARR
jgi:hypothetical protein